MYNQKLSSKPFKATIRKLSNMWNYCRVEGRLESMRDIAHEGSSEVNEQGTLKQNVLFVADVMTTQPADALVTLYVVPCLHNNVKMTGVSA